MRTLLWRSNYFIITLVLIFPIQSHAGLTPEEIGLTYVLPWTVINGWTNEMIQLKQSPSPQYKNQAVKKIIFHLPVGYPVIRPFGNATAPMARLDILSIYEPQRVATDKLSPKLLDTVLAVHHTDGACQLALPEYIDKSEKSPQEIKSDITEGSQHACLATRSQFESAYFRYHMHQSTGERYINDYSFLIGGGYANEKIRNYYARVPKFIFDSLLTEIKKDKDLNKKSKNGVTMIFLGCGEGKEVVIGKRKIENQLNVPVYSHGIEILPELVEKAKFNFSDYLDENCSISGGDALEADSIIKKIIEKKDPNGLVVVIAIGLIAEGVLKGTYPAHQILQGIAQSQRVDMILEASYGSHLFTDDTAEASGWAVKRKIIPDDYLRPNQQINTFDSQRICEVLHILTPISMDAQKETVLRHNYDVIDLSLSSHPEKIFRKIIQRPHDLKFDTVDISWAYMNSDKINLYEFIHLMQANGINKVAVSGYEPWYQYFKSISQRSILKVIRRIDSEEEHELPSILPYMARQIWSDYKIYGDASHESNPESYSGLIKAKASAKTVAVTSEDENISLPLSKLKIIKPPLGADK